MAATLPHFKEKTELVVVLIDGTLAKTSKYIHNLFLHFRATEVWFLNMVFLQSSLKAMHLSVDCKCSNVLTITGFINVLFLLKSSLFCSFKSFVVF